MIETFFHFETFTFCVSHRTSNFTHSKFYFSKTFTAALSSKGLRIENREGKKVVRILFLLPWYFYNLHVPHPSILVYSTHDDSQFYPTTWKPLSFMLSFIYIEKCLSSPMMIFRYSHKFAFKMEVCSVTIEGRKVTLPKILWTLWLSSAVFFEVERSEGLINCSEWMREGKNVESLYVSDSIHISNVQHIK